MGYLQTRVAKWGAAGGSAIAVLSLLTIVTAETRHHDPKRTTSAQGNPSRRPIPSSTTPRSVTPSRPARRTPTPTQPQLAARAIVTAALGKLAAQLPAGGVSVAALNTKTGAHFSFGASTGMRTGSVAKLFVLDALLAAHEHEGTPLPDDEQELARAMIENSDNPAEYQLYLDVGGREALVDLAARLGMRHTVPGSDDPVLTTTSAEDALHLLAPLLAKPITVAGVRHEPLGAYSRSVAVGFMRNVEADQRWGVSAVADPGPAVALKNGWLSVDDNNAPGENDGGRWLVNSVGIVTVRGQQVLLSVFTQHGPDYLTGVRLVEALAKAVTPAVVAE
jgi:beta-lactamase class A